MHTLIDLQRADGAWDLRPEFVAALGYELPRLEEFAAQASGDIDEVRSAWETALALTWLERHAADASYLWRCSPARPTAG